MQIIRRAGLLVCERPKRNLAGDEASLGSSGCIRMEFGLITRCFVWPCCQQGEFWRHWAANTRSSFFQNYSGRAGEMGFQKWLPEQDSPTGPKRMVVKHQGAATDALGFKNSQCGCSPGNRRLPPPALLQLSMQHGVSDLPQAHCCQNPHTSMPLLANSKDNRKLGLASHLSSKYFTGAYQTGRT